MKSADEGVVSLLYRPLETMDALHVLLLAAVAVQGCNVSLLEQVFSLPPNVIAKELSILRVYGLVQKLGDVWAATGRGRQLVEVWNTLQHSDSADIPATSQQWLMGPGEFSVDEMIRNNAQVAARAKIFGVDGATAAVKFLEERRATITRFETFLRN